ncbi:unnamed protein product, partial [marine sediment metagenome]
MNRKGENRAILLEDKCGTVPLVKITVYNQGFLDEFISLKSSNAHRYIINVTKPFSPP